MYHLDPDSGFIYYFESDSLHHVRADQFVLVPIEDVWELDSLRKVYKNK